MASEISARLITQQPSLDHSFPCNPVYVSGRLEIEEREREKEKIVEIIQCCFEKGVLALFTHSR